MEPESFFHVAIKTDDLEEGESFYRERFGAEVLGRGDAADGSGATAVERVVLDVADRLVRLFDEPLDEAADWSTRARRGSSTSGTSFRTSTPPTGRPRPPTSN